MRRMTIELSSIENSQTIVIYAVLPLAGDNRRYAMAKLKAEHVARDLDDDGMVWEMVRALRAALIDLEPMLPL